MAKDLEGQAYPVAVHIAGSILVLSVALKVIGIDFAPVMQALTKSIAQSIEQPSNSKLTEIDKRLKIVEELAHESSKKDH